MLPEEVRDASRMAEVLNRVITRAKRARLRKSTCLATSGRRLSMSTFLRLSNSSALAVVVAITAAAKLLSEAEFPVILNGAGVVLANAIPASAALAERLDARCAVAISTTTHSRVAPMALDLSATTVPKLLWNSSPRLTWCWLWAHVSTLSQPCLATVSTTGRRTLKSSGGYER